MRGEIERQHGRHPPILPVLSMFDARRSLHRDLRAGLAAGWPVVPASSDVERTALLNRPLGVSAPNCAASRALQGVWDAVEAKLAAMRGIETLGQASAQRPVAALVPAPAALPAASLQLRVA